VKRLASILFSILLAMQFAPTSASSTCVKPNMGNCANCCDETGCCATSNSQPAPAVPPQSNLQNQISLLFPVTVTWTVPENPANSFSPISTSPLTATGTPLYERNCVLLL